MKDVSGDLGYVEKERFKELREEIGDAESNDQNPGKQPLESLNPRPLGSFVTVIGVRCF